jgi:mono/diheme cytochrome c family protein
MSPATRIAGANLHGIIGRVLISGLFITTAAVSQDPAKSQEQYLARPSYLVMGDAAAGRRAYLALKCNTCHTVAGEPIGAKPPRLPGPQLGKSLALESPEQIADSIAAPQHRISKKSGVWRESNASTMSDYTHIMTVRQLMDLIAYLRSL